MITDKTILTLRERALEFYHKSKCHLFTAEERRIAGEIYELIMQEADRLQEKCPEG